MQLACCREVASNGTLEWPDLHLAQVPDAAPGVNVLLHQLNDFFLGLRIRQQCRSDHRQRMFAFFRWVAEHCASHDDFVLSMQRLHALQMFATFLVRKIHLNGASDTTYARTSSRF